MTPAPLTHALIREIVSREALSVGVAPSVVIGRSNGRRAVMARRRAVRQIVMQTGCSPSDLAEMWGAETRTITATLTEPAAIAPYDVATMDRLVWLYGPERAAAIVEGRDANTNADIAAWNRIGAAMDLTVAAIRAKSTSLRAAGRLPPVPPPRRSTKRVANPLGVKAQESPAALRAIEREEPPLARGDAWKPIPGVEPVPFMERASMQCRWPVGGEGAGLLCCGAHAQDGRYCSPHARIAFQPAKASASELIRSLRKYA